MPSLYSNDGLSNTAAGKISNSWMNISSRMRVILPLASDTNENASAELNNKTSQCQSNITVAKTAELLRSTQRRSRVTIEKQEMIAEKEMF